MIYCSLFSSRELYIVCNCDQSKNCKMSIRLLKKQKIYLSVGGRVVTAESLSSYIRGGRRKKFQGGV